MTTDRIRWGIAGTGAIAGQFATGLAQLDDAELVAVCSRSAARAEEFAARHGAARAHASYEALAEDPDVDVVYVATPNHRHATDTIRYLAAGRAVLCEKPFALDEHEAIAVFDAARASGTFVMEAMWSRFLPSWITLQRLVADGRIGTVTHVDADLGFPLPFDPDGRVFSPALGGGSLLDLGVYPVNLVAVLLGEPTSVEAEATLAETGVDASVVARLGFADGATATVTSSIVEMTSCTARVVGSNGTMEVPALMHAPDHLVVDGERVDVAHEGEGLRFEADEVQRRIRAGDVESPVMRWSDTLQVLRTLDRIRAAVG